MAMAVNRLGMHLVLASVFFAATAFAQQPAKDDKTVAKLIELQGTVLVGGVAGAKDQRVPVDAKVVTTTGAQVTIQYDKGCDIHLNENKRFTVREEGQCCLLADSVENNDGSKDYCSNPNANSQTALTQPPKKDLPTVAKLVNMEGTVLVSEGDAMAAGAKDQRVKIDTRIVTTAGAKVTIQYDRGCDVRLDENQRFTVTDRCGCCALLAAVEGIGAPVAAAGTTGITGLGILGAVGVGSLVVYGVGRSSGSNVSPN